MLKTPSRWNTVKDYLKSAYNIVRHPSNLLLATTVAVGSGLTLDAMLNKANSAEIHGVIRDRMSYEGIPAHVHIGVDSTETDEEGAFSLNMPDSTYHVVITPNDTNHFAHAELFTFTGNEEYNITLVPYEITIRDSLTTNFKTEVDSLYFTLILSPRTLPDQLPKPICSIDATAADSSEMNRFLGNIDNTPTENPDALEYDDDLFTFVPTVEETHPSGTKFFYNDNDGPYTLPDSTANGRIYQSTTTIKHGDNGRSTYHHESGFGIFLFDYTVDFAVGPSMMDQTNTVPATSRDRATMRLMKRTIASIDSGFHDGDPFGFLNTPIYDTLGVDTGNTVPPEQPLPDNYKVTASPMPFNSSVNISYTLPRQGFVQEEICDITGRVITSEKHWRTTGTNTFHWDGSNSPAGTYIYRQQIGDLEKAIKLIKTN